MQDLGDKQHQGEQSSDGKMAQPLAETLRLGKDWIGRSAHLLYLKFDLSRLQTADFAHACKGTKNVRNGDRAANDQRHVERVDYFLALPAFFAAADQVVSDAVIAAQHRGGDQPEQFLCFGAERARFVGLVVESEETLDAEVASAEDFFVEFGANFLKIFQAFGYGSAGGHIPTHQPCRYYGPTTAIPIA